MFLDKGVTMSQVFNLSGIVRESLPYFSLWLGCSVRFNQHLHDISASKKVSFLHLHYPHYFIFDKMLSFVGGLTDLVVQ